MASDSVDVMDLDAPDVSEEAIGDSLESTEALLPSISTNSPSFTTEGKVTINYDNKRSIFYNPTQEVNRDISILGIQSFIAQSKESKGCEKANILEAMAASGIRSIRYSKEIDNVDSILANDFSLQAVETLKENMEYNKVTNIIPNCEDASLLMVNKRNQFLVVDIDPYGSPIPFLDSALQCVRDGGMLLVTATDMAVLAGGNTPETCFSKYGSMSIKTKACQELALRILIHSVQSFANRYGKYVEPLLSLKIDFYVRIFFRVVQSPVMCKQVALQSSMVYQCTGCHMLSFQPLAIKKGASHYGCPRGPPVGPRCQFCDSVFHFGGPIWTGLIHNKEFVKRMADYAASEKYGYLGTSRRIQGLLQVVSEETDDILLYDLGHLSSVLRCTIVPMLKFRSALLHRGFNVSFSHTGPGLYKTNAPNQVLWEILAAWHGLSNGSKLKEGTAGYNILQKFSKGEIVPTVPTTNFELHPNANPASREMKTLRFQNNPTKNWGPGMRNAFDANRIRKKDAENNKNETNIDSCYGDDEGSEPVAAKKKKFQGKRKSGNEKESFVGITSESDTNIHGSPETPNEHADAMI